MWKIIFVLLYKSSQYVINEEIRRIHCVCAFVMRRWKHLIVEKREEENITKIWKQWNRWKLDQDEKTHYTYNEHLMKGRKE